MGVQTTHLQGRDGLALGGRNSVRLRRRVRGYTALEVCYGRSGFSAFVTSVPHRTRTLCGRCTVSKYVDSYEVNGRNEDHSAPLNGGSLL